MPEADAPAKDPFDEAVRGLAFRLARLDPGPLAQLRRAEPGEGVPAFWRLYHAQNLAERPGRDVDWEWVVIALARLTPTGNDPGKESVHDGSLPLGRALHAAGVSELRLAKVLNAPLDQRRETLMRLVRVLARDKARFNTCDLARLLLFEAPDPTASRSPLRRLAQSYFAAEADAAKAAAKKEGSDA